MSDRNNESNSDSQTLEEEQAMKGQIEYKCVLILGLGEKTSRILTEYAAQGWELVAVWWGWHYLKRAVDQG